MGSDCPVCPEKAAVKVKVAVSALGWAAHWKVSPARADASMTDPAVRGWPPRESTPVPGSGREFRVMALAWAKSSWVKEMDSPARQFLEKSGTAEDVSFLSQKKAAAGWTRHSTRAAARTALRPPRKGEKCFKTGKPPL